MLSVSSLANPAAWLERRRLFMRSQTRQHFSIARLVMTLVHSALRRRREIREVEPEIISPGDQKPWVLQLLSEGQLPGVNAQPVLWAVEPEQILEDEPPAARPIVDEPTLVEVVPEVVPEPVAEVVEPVSEPAPVVATAPPEPEPEPPLADERPKPAPPIPARKRRPKHRPVKRVAPPQRAAAHAPAAADLEAAESSADDVPTVACEIRVWRGYRKANFFACVFSDDGEPLAVAESPFFRAHGNGVPAKTDEAVAAHEQLREQLEAAGWRYEASGRTWFGDRYSRPL